VDLADIAKSTKELKRIYDKDIEDKNAIIQSF
jgi:hypothetical protein